MLRGSKDEKRAADEIGNAVHVMRVVIGEILDTPSKASNSAEGGKAVTDT